MGLTASTGYDRSRTSDESEITSTASKLQRAFEDVSRSIAQVLQTSVDISSAYTPGTRKKQAASSSPSRAVRFIEMCIDVGFHGRAICTLVTASLVDSLMAAGEEGNLQSVAISAEALDHYNAPMIGEILGTLMTKSPSDGDALMRHVFWPASCFHIDEFPRILFDFQAKGCCWLIPRDAGTAVVAVPKVLRHALRVQADPKKKEPKMIAVWLLLNTLVAVTSQRKGDSNKDGALDDKHFDKPNGCPVPRLPACMARIGERLTYASPNDKRQPSCLPFRLHSRRETTVDNPFWFAETDYGTLVEASADNTFRNIGGDAGATERTAITTGEPEAATCAVPTAEDETADCSEIATEAMARQVLSQLSPGKLLEKLVLRLLRCRVLWNDRESVSLEHLLSTDYIGTLASHFKVNCKQITNVPVVTVAYFPSLLENPDFSGGAGGERKYFLPEPADLNAIKTALDKHHCCAFAPLATYNLCGDVVFIFKCAQATWIGSKMFTYVGVCIQCKEWTQNSGKDVVEAFRYGKLKYGAYPQYNVNLKKLLQQTASRAEPFRWLNDVYWVHTLMTVSPVSKNDRGAEETTGEKTTGKVGPHEAFMSIGGKLGEDCPIIRQSLIAAAKGSQQQQNLEMAMEMMTMMCLDEKVTLQRGPRGTRESPAWKLHRSLSTPP